jgi:hypothetical protein
MTQKVLPDYELFEKLTILATRTDKHSMDHAFWYDERSVLRARYAMEWNPLWRRPLTKKSAGRVTQARGVTFHSIFTASGSARPVKSFQQGGVKVDVWRNPGQNGDMFNTPISNSYKDDASASGRRRRASARPTLPLSPSYPARHFRPSQN